VRQNSDNYNNYALKSERELRLVVSIEFSGTTYYFTSHDDIDTPEASTIHESLKNVNAKTQRYLPEQARSEIGRLKFSLLDVGEAVSDLLNDEQYNNDEGPLHRKVVLYRGFYNLAWSDYRVEMTQLIDSKISFEKNVYDFSCSDKQSQLKKNIFNFPSTRLSAGVTAEATTLSVYTTEGFDVVPQGTSYSYLPSTSVIMLRIKYQDNWEICSATGKTATTFTGVVRGLFGTVARAHQLPEDANSDNGVEVEYYPYLELPVAKLVYALLTGVLLNQGGAELPSAYHLAIPEADIISASFESYPDWYLTTDDTRGLILAFEGGAMSEGDGKAFIEKEILSLINAFLLVEPDGRLSLRRKVPVLSSSDYVGVLNENLISSVNALEHDLDAVSSRFRIRWGYREFGPNNKGFYRERVITDTIAAARFPDAKTKELAFKGLTPARHTTTILRNIFESQRDAVASPPLHLSGVRLMPSIGFDVELADVFRVDLSHVRDYQSLVDVSSLDRPFEVQRITIDQIKDSVIVDFVGSGNSATQIGDDDSGDSVIPDGAYTDTGTNLTSVLSIDGSGFTTADGTLTGGTTTRTRYYYDGDLTISAGDTIDFTGNIEIWVKGHFSILGKLDGAGGGYTFSEAGYIGTTMAQGLAYAVTGFFGNIISFSNGQTLFPQVTAIPALMIVNDAGVLSGYPDDMRGSGGPSGGISTAGDDSPVVGGVGGLGGGSVVIVSRGSSFGVDGEIDVSGTDGNLGSTGDYVVGGAGGGGSAGSVLILIDGSGNSVPIANGKITAFRGASPEQANVPVRGVDTKAPKESPTTRWGGWPGLPSVSQYDSNVRIQYLPVSRIPYENDQASLEPPSGVTVSPIPGGNDIDWDNPINPGSWDLIEIHASTTNDVATASKTFEGRNSRANHLTGNVTPQFYWLRSRQGTRFSDFIPNTTTTTYTGTPEIDANVAATRSNWSGIVDDDSNKPDNNATVGAIWGTNVTSQPADAAILNSFLLIGSDGTLSGGGGGSVTIVGLGYNGSLDATDNTITQSASNPSGGINGSLHYNTATKSWWSKIAGTWIKVGDETAANVAASIAGQGGLATVNSADWSSQVSGTGKPADNATVGAVWGVNVTSQPADAAILNSFLSIGSDGTLSGGGGGSVTIVGLGYNGSLDATDNTITQSASNPSGGINGSLHYNTATKSWWSKIAGTWIKVGDETAANVAASIAGQGGLATVNSADWSSQISGTGKPADNATANTQDLQIDSFVPSGNLTNPSLISNWTQAYNGAAPITLVSGSYFEFDEAGLYLVNVVLEFQLTIGSVSSGALAYNQFARLGYADNGVSYNSYWDCNASGMKPYSSSLTFASIDKTVSFSKIIAASVNSRCRVITSSLNVQSASLSAGSSYCDITRLKQVPD